MSKHFFDKRVHAVLNLLIKNNKLNKYSDILNDLEKNFSEYETSNLDNEKKWILSIKKTLIQKNIIEENILNKKILTILKDSKSISTLQDKEIEFFKGSNVEYKKINRIEGHPVNPGVSISVLFKSSQLLLLQIIREKGSIDPVHEHSDHNTVSYLLSGKLKILIGDNSYFATPKDVWLHKKNVLHSTKAIETSVQLSIKDNPIKTW